MLTTFDAGLLARSFPDGLVAEPVSAMKNVCRYLHQRQWTDLFDVSVCEEIVSIPYRLHFSSKLPDSELMETTHIMGKCLESRSNDGFQRQRAAQALMQEVQPWSAPFIIALIGEYVVEILRDLHDGLTPEAFSILADFVHANPTYWHITQQRVASYWNASYRSQFTRTEYAGFKLLNSLNRAVCEKD